MMPRSWARGKEGREGVKTGGGGRGQAEELVKAGVPVTWETSVRGQ